jgi:hypothetical protein
MDENKVASWCEPASKTQFQYAQFGVIVVTILVSTFLIFIWWGVESRKQALAHEEWLSSTTQTPDGKRIKLEVIVDGNTCVIRTMEFLRQQDGTFHPAIFKKTDRVCSSKK